MAIAFLIVASSLLVLFAILVIVGDMLVNIAALGNDLEFRSSVAAPTIAIAEMTISGQ